MAAADTNMVGLFIMVLKAPAASMGLNSKAAEPMPSQNTQAGAKYINPSTAAAQQSYILNALLNLRRTWLHSKCLVTAVWGTYD